MQSSIRKGFRPGWLLVLALSAGGAIALFTGSGQTSASPRASGAPAPVIDTAEDDPHAGLVQEAMPPLPGQDDVGEGACTRERSGGHAGGHGAGHGTAVANAVKPGEIARAPGPDARTVAEVLDGAPELAGKQVRVAARVVKVVTGVLGRNWLHIQDGSGSEAAGNHDLIVTTEASVSVGDEVIVEGRVTRDKDLGSGYRYDTLVEDASVTVRERTATR